MMIADIRHEFPVTERWAFLNHANVAPLSRRARDRVRDWADTVAENGDFKLEDWFAEIERTRCSAAALLGAKASEVAFLKNTSEGISLVAEGFPWQRGDNVVVPRSEFPSNLYPWMHLRERGVELRAFDTPGNRFSVEDVEQAVNSRTRVVSVSFVQFASGFRADLEAIGAFCRSRGIDFLVDAIQGLGVVPLNVEQMQIDYLVANSHKWLASPQGAAVFYIRRNKLEKIRPITIGWKSVTSPHKYSQPDFCLRDDAARFECGSFVIPSILGFGASLSLFLELGMPTISATVRHSTDYLVSRLIDIGATVVSPRGNSEWSGIVSFTLPKVDFSEIVSRCASRQVLIGMRGECLRASIHCYNNNDDVDRLIAAIAKT